VRPGPAALGALLAALALACAGEPAEPVDAVARAERELGLALESHPVDVGEVALHVVRAGPVDGPPVLLLHGIPELWYGWRKVIGPLAEAGYRVIVPDLRGFGRSEKPPEVEDYHPTKLKGDVLGLLDALGRERAFLAGHDAGGGVAWYVAIEHPERVRALASFGIAHPHAYRAMREEGSEPFLSRAFYGTLSVLLGSELPEWLARRGRWALLTWILREIGEPGAFPERELEVYRHAWEHEEAFHTILHWYRASFRYGDSVPYASDGRVRVPTLAVVLGADPLVPQEPVRRSERFGEDVRVAELPEAAHWVLQQRPEAASRLLLDFFGSVRDAEARAGAARRPSAAGAGS